MEYQLVVFELANEQYGLDIASVESIIKMQPITRMPQTPDFIEGVSNLRGYVLPVIDLRKRFGLTAVENTKNTRIVVVYMGEAHVGMIVDGVSQVLRISGEAVEPPPSMISTANAAFIKGIAKIDDQLVILMDLEKVLSLEEITQLK